MNSQLLRPLYHHVLVASMLLVAGVPLGAQVQRLTKAQEIARRVPVTIALVDSLSANNPVVIARRASASAHDVVLVRPSATGDQLTAALVALNTHRDLSGDTPLQDARLRTTTQTPGGFKKSEVQRANRIITRLKTQSPQIVEGFGRLPSTVVYLPSKSMRDGQRKTHPGT
jgi:hypothetical protein